MAHTKLLVCIGQHLTYTITLHVGTNLENILHIPIAPLDGLLAWLDPIVAYILRGGDILPGTSDLMRYFVLLYSLAVWRTLPNFCWALSDQKGMSYLAKKTSLTKRAYTDHKIYKNV